MYSACYIIYTIYIYIIHVIYEPRVGCTSKQKSNLNMFEELLRHGEKWSRMFVVNPTTATCDHFQTDTYAACMKTPTLEDLPI